MLETHFPFFLSKKKKKKKNEFRYMELYGAKKLIMAYFSLKIDIFMSVVCYYVIVTSYVEKFS